MTLNQFFFPDIHRAPQDDSLTRMTTPCPHLHAVFTVYSSSSGIYKKKKKSFMTSAFFLLSPLNCTDIKSTVLLILHCNENYITVCIF